MTVLPINKIKLDEEIQSRINLDDITIAEYAGAMSAGDSFPPIVVFFDGLNFWLADGFHRLLAAQKIGKIEIAADVKSGDRRAAILYSVGANAAHGLRRSNDDKRRAVMTLLNDGEWAQWSDSKIARQTKTSHTFVAKLRSYLETFQDSPRLVRRGDSVYAMDTAKIGQQQTFTKSEAPKWKTEEEYRLMSKSEALEWEADLESSLKNFKISCAEIGNALKEAKSVLTSEQFTAWLSSVVNMTPTEADFFMSADSLNLGPILDGYLAYFERRYSLTL